MLITSWVFSFSLLLILSLSVYTMNLSGSLNIGVEGIFLWAIFSSYFFISIFNSLFLSLFFSFLSVSFFSFLFSFLRFYGHINENLIGIFLNLLLFQLLDLINKICYQGKGVLLFDSPITNLLYFRFLIILISVILFFIMAYLLRRTSLGLKMRMNSLPSFYQKERGITPYRIRIIIFSISSILIVVSAFSLLLSLNAYTLGLGVGMGWLSLFALLLGRNSLLGILLSSAFLSLIMTLSFNLQDSLGFYFSSSITYAIALISYFLVQFLRSKNTKGFPE